MVMAVVLLAVPMPAHAQDEVTVGAAVDAAAIARTDPRLVGVGWDPAPFVPRAMAPLHPNLVRIDASLEVLYARGPTPDPDRFDALTDEVRSAIDIGATPVVILSYTPAWLGDEQRPHTDITRVPPSDAAAWQTIVRTVVERLSAAGARWFEAWNEPDHPVFFQGLPSEFLEDVYRPSALAVREVAKRTGRDLRFGGCACALPEPAYIVSMMLYARANDLPLDFVSWHYYGNTPFLGPDGTEPIGPPESQQLLGALHQRNPLTSAAVYAEQIELVRSWRDAVFADAGAKPELWIDEWNLSAGGFDERHDTAEGAAFQAASLVEFQRAGLDRAAVFRSVDPFYGPDVVPAEPELYGGWGLVGREATVKPAWRANAFWSRLGRDVLSFSPRAVAERGVSVLLTRHDRGRFVVLAANFHASAGGASHVVVALGGAGRGTWSVVVTDVDGTRRAARVASDGTLSVPVELGPQSAVLVEISRGL
jgi:glycosyl hydrolase family 39 (putative alpha-L-iduronidase)